MVVGIGDVEFSTGQRQAARLREPCRIETVARLAVARPRRRFVPLQVDFLDLVIVAVGDVEESVAVHDAQRMLQPRLTPDAVDVAKLEQRASARQIGRADHRGHPALAIERNPADGRAFAVDDVQELPVGGHARRLCHRRFRQRTVRDVFPAGAGVNADRVGAEFVRPHLVRPGHSDVQRAVNVLQRPGTVERGLPQFSF